MDSWRDSRSLSPFSGIPSKSNWREWEPDNYWEDDSYTPIRSTFGKRKGAYLWECLMCLHEFADRNTLRQHLAETGHNKPEAIRRERSTHRISNGDLKPRRRNGTICRICGEEYRSFHDLEKHIHESGHRWSYRKARLLSLQQIHDDEEETSITSLDNTSIPHSSSGSFRSREKRNICQSPENEDLLGQTSNIPEGSSQKERDVTIIPTKVNPSLQTNDPRKLDHSKRLEIRIERKPLDRDVPFIERSLEEDIPWRLIPLQKPTVPSVGESYERPCKMSKLDMLDQLAEKLKENTSASFIPKSRSVCRSLSDIGPIPLPSLSATCSSRGPQKNSFRKLDKKVQPPSLCTSKVLKKKSTPSTPTLDEPTSETGSSSSCDAANSYVNSNPVLSTTCPIQDRRDKEEIHRDTALQKSPITNSFLTQQESASYLPIPFPKANSYCTSDDQNLGPLDSNPRICAITNTAVNNDESLEVQMAILFGEDSSSTMDSSCSDSFLQPITVRVEQIVENCQGCDCNLSIDNITINYKTGDVTVFCGECGAYTIMEGVYQLKQDNLTIL